MFNLLKSDMYRLVHGKMLWVVTAIVVAASVFVVAMMHAVSSPEGPAAAAASVAAAAEAVEDVAENAAEAEKGAASGSASAELWASVAEDPQALSEADFEDVSREMRTFTTPADMLGDSVVSGGMLTLIVALVAALFCAQDFTTRFARNLVMDRRGRVRYYGEKIVLVGVLAAFFLAVVSLTSVASRWQALPTRPRTA